VSPSLRYEPHFWHGEDLLFTEGQQVEVTGVHYEELCAATPDCSWSPLFCGSGRDRECQGGRGRERPAELCKGTGTGGAQDVG
jgi:hypothetical protein